MSDFDITSNVNAKAHVTSQEKEEMYKHVIWKGAQAAGVAAGLATTASLVAQRFSPNYQRIKLPFKTFIVLALTTGTFFTVADRTSIRISRAFAARRSAPIKGYEGDEAGIVQPITGAREWMIKNRYPLVMTLWSGTLAGAFLWNWGRRDIKTAQKVINSRMVAQTMALAGIGGLAALAGTDPYETHVDRHFEKVMEAGESAAK
ncbi:hypothetical protein DFJ77DRAFT_516384 [Powellomyces hirtus]|nr:hypothetical protein DFJ77DRAFT_516384 [Powellomyces hirtus]